MTASQRKILFCDALPVYEKLLHHDLIAPDVLVVTRSFVMAQHMKERCVYIDGHISVDQRKYLKFSIPNVEQRLIKHFDFLGFQNQRKIFFSQFFNGFQNDILDALLLETVLEPELKIIVAVPETNRCTLTKCCAHAGLTGWTA